MNVTVASMPHVEAAVQGSGGVLYKATAHLDSGCGISCASRAYVQANLHRFCGEGSTARLMRLTTPVSVGMFAGQHSSIATHVLQGVKLHIGKGIYPVDLLLIDEGNFDLVLGNSFLVDYAGRIWTRDVNDRSSGRYLVLPLQQRFCKPGVSEPQPPAKRGRFWYPSQMVPMSYELAVDTWSVVPAAGL